MNSTVVMVDLFGAISLLLFGLAAVRDGVAQAFGARLRTGLAAGTSSGPRSFLSGLVATVALQSSTATALMVGSFVERDLIKPRMAQLVLLGANVGTAITAWIVATGLHWLSPLLILVGVVLRRGRSVSRQGGGTAVVGIGLMLLALHLLGAATEPLRQSPALIAFLGLLNNAWLVALAFSAVIAAVSSSSLATVMLILSLASGGGVPDGLVVALVLGANLGGAVGPVIASLSATPSVKRVALANLIVRAVGCLLALPFAGIAGMALAALPLSAARLPVDAHLAFNLALAVLAAPLAPALVRLMQRLVPAAAPAGDGPKYLDETELPMPAIALVSATREVLRVGDLIERMLMLTRESLHDDDLARLGDVRALERRVDQLQQAVKLFLSRLGRDGLSPDNAHRATVIIDYVINLEHIGDIVEKGLLPQIAKKSDLALKFSDDGVQEIDRLFDMTIDNFRVAQTIIATPDFALARHLMEEKVEVRRMEKQSAVRHLERLRDGHSDSVQTSSLHLDILNDLKRINAHIISAAHPILDEHGALRESRMRKP